MVDAVTNAMITDTAMTNAVMTNAMMTDAGGGWHAEAAAG